MLILGGLLLFLEGVANFRLHYLSHFFFNFEHLSAHDVANILNFPNHPQLLHLDDFEGSYGRFSTKGHFFGETQTKSYLLLHPCMSI